jgi:hypothetical protein
VLDVGCGRGLSRYTRRIWCRQSERVTRRTPPTLIDRRPAALTRRTCWSRAIPAAVITPFKRGVADAQIARRSGRLAPNPAGHAAPVYPGVLKELLPGAWHHVEQYANNRIADHGQLKHRLRPMRGLRTDRTAQVLIAGHPFLQNLRRGHYEFGVDTPPTLWVVAAFTELLTAI